MAHPQATVDPDGAEHRLDHADDGDPAGTAVKSADRVLQIFDLIAAKGPLTFSEVVAELELPASSTHNLLKTLTRRSYLFLDPEGRRYHLGLRLWEVAQAYAASDSLPRLAQPIMDRVVEETGETVQLSRLDGIENVYLAISESPQPIKLVSAVGKRLYAHATGLGKVLLAGLPEAEVRRRLAHATLPRLTANTIVDPEALLLALREIRARGYATDDEEYVIGCRCVAMPIRDARGSVVAAMSVSIPTPRFSEELVERIHHALAGAVEELSSRLGHIPSTGGGGATQASEANQVTTGRSAR
jgi:IclR family KDG regulon transcriptional repressor